MFCVCMGCAVTLHFSIHTAAIRHGERNKLQSLIVSIKCFAAITIGKRVIMAADNTVLEIYPWSEGGTEKQQKELIIQLRYLANMIENAELAKWHASGGGGRRRRQRRPVSAGRTYE